MNLPEPSDVPSMVIITLLTLGAGIVAWSFDQFQTKDAASAIERRLERMEIKLDQLMERVR